MWYQIKSVHTKAAKINLNKRTKKKKKQKNKTKKSKYTWKIKQYQLPYFSKRKNIDGKIH